MRTRKLLAVVLAAVLGIVCGTATAFLFPSNAGVSAGEHADPLGIGIPMLNQTCTDKSLILVNWGDSATPLGPAVSRKGAHYLQTARSCDTDWKYHGPTTTYAAYLGPFDTPTEACRIRMTPEYKGTFVTRLHDGNTDFVQCACYLDFHTMPRIVPGATITATTGMWTRALQQMLYDIDYTTTHHNTGVLAGQTLAAVRRLQVAQALEPTGIVDAETWSSLLQQACRLYSS